MHPSSFRILSLSGGGYRGLYTATVLEQLESLTEKKARECCDLICGTSIGGIIALGLVAGLKSQDIAQAFKTDGKEIFTKGAYRMINLWTAKYDEKGLEKVIVKMFGNELVNKKLTSIEKPFFLTAVNLKTGMTELITNRNRDYDNWTIMDAARATSAAPTYFPLKEVDGTKYADGGLSCNVPDMAAYSFSSSKFQKDLGRIQMLSIGTGFLETSNADYGKLAEDSGIFRWGTNLVDVVGDAQRNLIVDQCENLTPPGSYFRIDHCFQEEIKLDDTSENVTSLLIEAGNSSVDKHVEIPFIQSFFS